MRYTVKISAKSNGGARDAHCPDEFMVSVSESSDTDEIMAMAAALQRAVSAAIFTRPILMLATTICFLGDEEIVDHPEEYAFVGAAGKLIDFYKKFDDGE